MHKAVTLPELGENVETAEVLTVLVSVGDHIEKEQPLIEVETEKAAVQVPAATAGVVTAIRVKPGDTIRVGDAIIELDSEGDEGGDTPPTTEAPGTQEAAVASAGAPPLENRETPPDGAGAETVSSGPGAPEEAAPAAPSVRRLARELGIDINQVTGSGPEGRIATEDVMRHARMLIQEKRTARRGAAAFSGFPELPDFSRYGPIQRQPMSGVRRTTAQHTSRSWVTIPHVTQFDRADITELERQRQHFTRRAEAAGSHLTMTAVVIKVVTAAVKLFPKFNASIDAEHDEIIFKQYVNIGVAVDTNHGLLVPVIRDVGRKNLIEIGRALTELSERARARKSRPEDLRGAGLTVTNLGGLGTTYFSPLINWPEVAVVGIGRATQEAVYHDGAFAPRLLLPLAVSYDHRLIDGADAARFLRWIAEALEHPLALALNG
jgi:pyruvate dehydrogenase E2 component (dihydrolipoamide acetyltransferase)